jgi:hypothetical protein
MYVFAKVGQVQAHGDRVGTRSALQTSRFHGQKPTMRRDCMVDA